MPNQLSVNTLVLPRRLLFHFHSFNINLHKLLFVDKFSLCANLYFLRKNCSIKVKFYKLCTKNKGSKFFFFMDGFYVWYTDIQDITDEEFTEYLSSLSSMEHKKVMAFLFPDDRKRALLSIMLQRSLIRHHFRIGETDYTIEKTKEVRKHFFSS